MAFVATIGLALAGRAVVATGTGESGVSLLSVGIALLLVGVAPIGLVLLLANLQERPTASDFALRPPPLGRSIGLAIAFWVGINVLTLLWVVALGLDAEEGPLTERLGTEGTLTVVILFVILTVVTPVGEEFLFRGYIFRALRNLAGLWPAAITTGLLFAATHVGWLPLAFFVPIVLFGIGMCLVYHWTGSLYPGIAAHALNNSVPLGFALDWSWQIPMLVACSVVAALVVAKLIAGLLGDRPQSGDT